MQHREEALEYAKKNSSMRAQRMLKAAFTQIDALGVQSAAPAAFNAPAAAAAQESCACCAPTRAELAEMLARNPERLVRG
jgi:hypothetical protein